MSVDDERGHLRLVENDLSEQVGERSQGDQLSFIFEDDAFLMVLVDLASASEADFKDVVNQVRPDAVVDLRLVPRFDFGRLNRLVVFRMFEELAAQYYDLLYSLGVERTNDASRNPVFLAEPIADILQKSPLRRVLILLDDESTMNQSLEVFSDKMPVVADGGWRIRRFADL